ncbi:hypothetical protein V8C37DRAFT_419627 [Trichoderma ceciliae]
MAIGTVVKVPNDVEERTSSHLPYEMAVVERPRDAGLHGIDRLVQDLLASHKSLEDEKRKVVERDAEIAQLKEKMAHLEAGEDGQKPETAGVQMQELELMSAMQSTHDGEVNELRRLLTFHKTNGEQVSRQFRDLQATNRDLQVSLQATEKALEEQASLLSGLGLHYKSGESK